MRAQKLQTGMTGPPGALSRPDWQAGAEFTAADLRLEQKYNEQRIRRHLRMVHGWGVVCGLTVVPAGEGWWLFICPGYGIGPCGDEIVVLSRYRFNLRDYLWTRPLGGNAGNIAWISIEAAEYQEDVELAASCGCGCGSCNCDHAHEEAGYTAVGFRVVVSWTQPVFYRGSFDACGGGVPGCPACPDTCALPLAAVTLPAANEPVLSSGVNIAKVRG